MRSSVRVLLPVLLTLCACSAEGAESSAAAESSIFNGTSFEGWIVTGGERSFMIEEGVLAFGDEAGMLTWGEELGEFELRCEMRSDAGSSAGIAVRAPLDGTSGGSPVVVLADQLAGAMGKDASGSIRGVAPARAAAMEPTGAWNKLVIRMQGGKLMVSINGVVTADAMVQASPRGHLALVGDGEFFWLRNLRLQRL